MVEKESIYLSLKNLNLDRLELIFENFPIWEVHTFYCLSEWIFGKDSPFVYHPKETQSFPFSVTHKCNNFADMKILAHSKLYQLGSAKQEWDKQTSLLAHWYAASFSATVCPSVSTSCSERG